MVIKSTWRSRSAPHKPQVKSTPKVEEKKIEEVKPVVEPAVEEIVEPIIEEAEVQAKEEPVVEQEEKRPAPRKKKKAVKKPEEEKVVFNAIDEDCAELEALVESDDMDALLKELLEEE